MNTFNSRPLIFNVFSWQQQTPGFLNLLKVKTTLHYGMDLCTRSLGDMLQGWCLLTRCHPLVNILLKAWVKLASFTQVTSFKIRMCFLRIKEEFLRNTLMKHKKNVFLLQETRISFRVSIVAWQFQTGRKWITLYNSIPGYHQNASIYDIQRKTEKFCVLDELKVTC